MGVPSGLSNNQWNERMLLLASIAVETVSLLLHASSPVFGVFIVAVAVL